MMQHLPAFVGLVFVASTSAFAQTVELRTQPASEDRYNRISFVAEGPTTIVLVPPVSGRYFRLVVHEGRLASDAPTLRIEAFSHGAGGCCRTLERARDVDFAEPLSKSLGPFDPQKGSFEFVLWLGATAFEFNYGGVNLWMSELHTDQVKVQHGKKTKKKR